jgi:hypothetical protein
VVSVWNSQVNAVGDGNSFVNAVCDWNILNAVRDRNYYVNAVRVELLGKRGQRLELLSTGTM